MTSLIDVIIFDTPPIEECSDTLAIAAAVNASVLVVKAGKEQPKMLQKAQEVLAHVKAPVLGVIVNGQTPKRQSYFYASRYPVPLKTYDVGEIHLSPRRELALSPVVEPVLLAERPSGLVEKQSERTSPPLSPIPNSGSLGLGQR